MVEIICEAGVNHKGKLRFALLMVDAAVMAGGKIVKFQTFNPDVITHTHSKENVALKELALSHSDFATISKHCENMGIEFMSTPGDIESLKFLLNETNIKRIKIGSDDLTYPPLVHAAAQSGLPLIMSTGMATVKEIRDAIPRSYYQTRSLTLMHCVSLYPCLPQDVNLRAIITMGHIFGSPIGYSDHTKDITACFCAAAIGAVMLEKHFYVSDVNETGEPCVDYPVSVSEKELRDLILAVDELETMLGSGIKTPGAAERAACNQFRKQADGKRMAAP